MLLMIAIVLAFYAKSYVIQEMLFWVFALAAVFTLVMGAIGLVLLLRHVGRRAFHWVRLTAINISANKHTRSTARDLIGPSPHR